MRVTEAHRARLRSDLDSSSCEGLSRFVVANRQTGSTTALVKAAVEADGYLIVDGSATVRKVLGMDARLRPERVLMVQQVRDGEWSFDPRPVFVDAAVLWGMK